MLQTRPSGTFDRYDSRDHPGNSLKLLHSSPKKPAQFFHQARKRQELYLAVLLQKLEASEINLHQLHRCPYQTPKIELFNKTSKKCPETFTKSHKIFADTLPKKTSVSGKYQMNYYLLFLWHNSIGRICSQPEPKSLRRYTTCLSIKKILIFLR